VDDAAAMILNQKRVVNSNKGDTGLFSLQQKRK